MNIPRLIQGRRRGFLVGGNESSAGGQPTTKYPKNRKRHRIWAISFSNLEGTSPPNFSLRWKCSVRPPAFDTHGPITRPFKTKINSRQSMNNSKDSKLKSKATKYRYHHSYWHSRRITQRAECALARSSDTRTGSSGTSARRSVLAAADWCVINEL